MRVLAFFVWSLPQIVLYLAAWCASFMVHWLLAVLLLPLLLVLCLSAIAPLIKEQSRQAIHPET